MLPLLSVFLYVNIYWVVSWTTKNPIYDFCPVWPIMQLVWHCSIQSGQNCCLILSTYSTRFPQFSFMCFFWGKSNGMYRNWTRWPNWKQKQNQFPVIATLLRFHLKTILKHLNVFANTNHPLTLKIFIKLYNPKILFLI